MAGAEGSAGSRDILQKTEEAGTEAAGRTALLRELVRTVYPLGFSVYSPDGTLLSSDGTHSRAMADIFAAGGCREYMVRAFQDSQSPVLLSMVPGLVWGAMPEEETDRSVSRIHLLGPVFLHPIDEKALSAYAKKLEVALPWRKDFLTFMQAVPVISLVSFQNILLMLARALTGRTLSRSAIAWQDALKEEAPQHSVLAVRDRSHTYRAETALLDHIRNGDPDFAEDLTRASLLAGGPAVDIPDPLDRIRLSCISFVTLSARAAIEGGLSPDDAYTLQDEYLQTIMQARNAADAASGVNAMYEDFIGRVASLKASAPSQTIRNVIEYLRLHLEEPFSLKETAERFGYSEYYLSRRFKRETGLTMGAFIRRERVRRSTSYLVSTDLPIQEIADLLHFSSSSHFAQSFREEFGCLPSRYREEAGRD